MSTYLTSRWPEAYQANTFSDGLREGTKGIHRRVQLFNQAVMTNLRSVKFLDLLLKVFKALLRISW